MWEPNRMFQSLRYWLGVALLVSAVAGAPFRPGHAQTLVDSTGAASWGDVGLFGSQEIKSDTLKASPQWRRVLASFLAEQTDFDRCVADRAACLSPMQKNWRQMVQSAAKLAPREQLAAVNGYFNRMP